MSLPGHRDFDKLEGCWACLCALQVALIWEYISARMHNVIALIWAVACYRAAWRGQDLHAGTAADAVQANDERQVGQASGRAGSSCLPPRHLQRVRGECNCSGSRELYEINTGAPNSKAGKWVCPVWTREA